MGSSEKSARKCFRSMQHRLCGEEGDELHVAMHRKHEWVHGRVRARDQEPDIHHLQVGHSGARWCWWCRAALALGRRRAA